MFANPAPQQQQQQPSIFGNQTQPAQPGGGLFGGTQTNTSNPLFGGQQQQPNPNPLFGGAQPQQAAKPNPLFGGQPPPPNQSIFGSSTATNTQQPSLFGSTNTNTNQQPTNIFGNQAPTQPNQPSLFGSTNLSQQNTGAPGGTLFGSTNTNNQQQQPQNNALFGGTANQAPKPAGSIFGGGSASFFGGSTNNNTLNTSALGTTNNGGGGGIFGGQNNNAPTNNTNNMAAGSLFGGGANNNNNNNNSLLSSRAPLNGAGGGSAYQQADAQAQFAQLTQRIESVAQAWNATSRDCRFQYYFYNLVDPNHVNMYGRPANATNEELWQQAVRGNPDPSCLVPVLAVGFDDLRQRVDAQSQQAAAHQDKLKELKTRVAALAQRHATSNASRAQRAASTQTQLTQRLVALVQHLHLLIPSLRASALKPEEEALRGLLEAIEEEVRRGRGQGKLNELWALVGTVNATRRNGASATDGRGEWAVVDEEGMAQLSKILTDQQLGLAHLTKVLLRALKDLSVITGTESTSVRDSEMRLNNQGDHLWSSTSTLRESSLR